MSLTEIIAHAVLTYVVFAKKTGKQFLVLEKISHELKMIFFILNTRSRIALFILVGFHIFSTVSNLMFKGSPNTIHVVFRLFHLIIGIVIYLNDCIEEKLNTRQNRERS